MALQKTTTLIYHFSYILNFDLTMKNEIHDHSWKEHLIIEAKLVKGSAKIITNLHTLHGYIFLILHHVATKPYNSTNFKTLFLAVVTNFALAQIKIQSVTKIVYISRQICLFMLPSTFEHSLTYFRYKRNCHRTASSHQ